MNIAVTGLNSTDNPGPGVPVIRSIREEKKFKGRIIGFVYDSLEPGIYFDDLVNAYYTIPYPSSGREILLERIAHIHEKEKIDLIIPTLDSEILGFIAIEKDLNKLGIKTFLPTSQQYDLRAKDKLFSLCQKNKIKVPKNILATSIKDIVTIQEHFSYPIVVKGIFYDAFIAHNFEEAVVAFNKLSLKWGFPIIIQEFIDGGEFNVVALGDGLGDTVGAVGMKKLYITDKGKGWSGVTIDDNEILKISYNIIKAMKWRSGLELEFIKSSATNEYYLLEINPRFPAWVYLAPKAGQNLPFALVNLAFGKKVIPFTKYKIGRMFIRTSWDLISDISTFEKITVKGELIK